MRSRLRSSTAVWMAWSSAAMSVKVWMGEMMRLKVMPDNFDVVEFGRVFGQPLDGEPMGAGGQGRPRELADVDRPIILDEHDRLGGLARHGAEEPVELLQMRHKVAAAFGRAGGG